MLACSVICLENSLCLSFAFNDIKGVCILWDQNLIGDLETNTVDEYGLEYYNIIIGLYIFDWFISI